jgi:NADH:ubiquinone oxidoreductase subunit
VVLSRWSTEFVYKKRVGVYSYNNVIKKSYDTLKKSYSGAKQDRAVRFTSENEVTKSLMEWLQWLQR